MLVNDKIIVLCNTDFLEGHSLKRLVSEYQFPLESGYLCQEKLAFSANRPSPSETMRASWGSGYSGTPKTSTAKRIPQR